LERVVEFPPYLTSMSIIHHREGNLQRKNMFLIFKILPKQRRMYIF